MGTATWAHQPGIGIGGTTALDSPQPASRSDSSAVRATTDLIPAAPARTFLRFQHRPQFGAHGGDGGVVEYQADGTTTWSNVGDARFTENGYADVILASDDSPLEGQDAFTFSRDDWTISRVDVSDLGGQRVRFRFRSATDNSSPGGDGWYVDDVAVYTCTPVALPGAPTGVSATGGFRQADVTWVAPVSPGGGPITGWTVIALANGTTPGSPVAVAGGAARSATLSGLTMGTPYTFKVAAVNQGGTGPLSVASKSVVPTMPPLEGSIVYVKAGNVWLSAPDGTAARQLTTDGTADLPYQSPSQSDDGATIVATRNYRTGVGASEYQVGRVFVLDRQGGIRSVFEPGGQFTPTGGMCSPIQQVPVGISTANVSPDGSKVA